MIGRFGLGFLENTPEIELGYVFDKSHWNMGLATEASVATLKFGFWQVKLDRIVAMPTAGYAYAHPENIASVRVIQKVGMKYEKNASYYGHDVVYYAISRTQWQPDDFLYILQS